MGGFNPLSRITSFFTIDLNNLFKDAEWFQSPYEDYVLPGQMTKQEEIREGIAPQSPFED